MNVLVSLLLAFSAYNTHAWSISFGKDALQKVAAAAGVSAALTMAPIASHAVDGVPFSGSYADPFHPNCKRVIELVSGSNMASLTGTDGTPGCPPDGSGRAWKLSGIVDGSNILVDFSPKGGPRNLKGFYDTTAPEGIKWPDGNKWAKL
mmetsp:Transcript_2289/g.3151  ORF Transcript_2289/g.3151 Transcript_2289/m.3151 type:complete len:149 (+) Transcript_2289:97-543(+)|eukprot:CAMPEP_0198143382 /NCGR_PEP_ID=MMETSP1443-20131203/6959_1 /TAXON_ID=186043 /ORGANISM="Entomoneis sp., Strain CCMP2396" /LENGTH=148 /DNA_ID=CAMNT_0043806611 /DNA_START=23 /DNA_END=469 /DNA_ORIENTATION=-